MFGNVVRNRLVQVRLSGLGYVDPMVDSVVDDTSSSVPFGPQPTPETVAQNYLIDNGYMPDPNAPVPSSGWINVASGLPVAAPAAAPATTSLSTWLSSLFKPAVSTLQPGLPPGPAPRVANPPPIFPTSSASVAQLFTGSTLIAGVPNVLVIAGGFLAVSLLLGRREQKRRR